MEFKNVACVSTKIKIGLARLGSYPLNHPSYLSVLNDLANLMFIPLLSKG